MKTYNDDQFIAGWGQYLQRYLPSSVEVINCAEGGRSSRSFINEGRLYDIEDDTSTFSQNSGKSIAQTIDGDDYLFIQFGHNDDDTKSYDDTSYKYERFVPLGMKDANGIYPTIAPTNKQSTTENLPSDMKSSTKTSIAKYGSEYFAYEADGSNGTYKGFLKEYIDIAREIGATPVLVTPVARVSFNSDGTIKSGPGLHGDGFAYVQAVKQLAEEEDVMYIDLFEDSKNMLETCTSTYAYTVMALKPNSLVGTWPQDFDAVYNDNGHEGTHYNKYGAFVEAAYVAEALRAKNINGLDGEETIKFDVNQTPSAYINPSNLTPKATSANIEAAIKGVSVTDPNRTYPDPKLVVSAINNLPEVSDITNENYLEVNEQAKSARLAYISLNIDDRSSVTNLSKLANVEAKVKELIEAAKPKATAEYEFDCTALSAATVIGKHGEYTVVDSTGEKMVYSGGALKFGGNGSSSDKYVSITLTGNGTVSIVLKAFISDTSKNATLAVQQDSNTAKTLGVTTGNASDIEFEFEINGTSTFYIYRSSGSTGPVVNSITTSYFENK